MAYPKIKVNGAELEINPDTVKKILSAIIPQVKNLTLMECLELYQVSNKSVRDIKSQLLERFKLS